MKIYNITLTDKAKKQRLDILSDDYLTKEYSILHTDIKLQPELGTPIGNNEYKKRALFFIYE